MPLPATAQSMASPSRLLLLLGLLLAGGAQAAEMFCCQDPHTGRRVCGDALPDQCRGKPYRVLDGAGNVIREVEGALTPEQKAQRAAQEKQRKAEEAALKEQRRMDQALLDTYGSLQDIDIARDRAVGLTQEAIQRAEAKIAEIRQRRKKWENEAEFYKKGNLPPEVDKGLREADYELRAYGNLLESKNKELEQIRRKYDEDRRRFLDITAGGRRTLPPPPPQ